MILSIVCGLPLTEKYDNVPDVKLPNNEARGNGWDGEVFANGFYVIGLISDRKRLIVADNLYDEYVNYQTWDIDIIISLSCKRSGKVIIIKNINELCVGDEIDIVVSGENWERFNNIVKRSPYLDKEEIRKTEKVKVDKKRDERVTKQQKELKEAFRKRRQNYLDELKMKDRKIYDKEIKEIGNQYDERIDKPKKTSKKQKRKSERQGIIFKRNHINKNMS